ncbi:thiamine-monophosphate kinase [Thermus scotoductus]|jgi:thiamine-monophosphate kinase|uniref:Thiamine-monophosphate kinase n=2 Tax=Thermus scotoductus TaxID=37636 RepID=A0A430SD26_THESC|nr:thiamine-phosphate kinase [Thermus scotoductus]RTG97177.1 thiamine-monophosphate kinase [Thermus scotoductus]RTH09561.1 thiamine-monophosphate kinase [Thermus scotoductus]RTH12067.1 thiamine-monophosphate kinase [Thermus scotoductus]RTH13904.1 thiamine-monophosphate kinase [Thermus scotoductus]RTH18604.1 thiamine-monophosphate kinase [Thermus scotoductus]
MRLKDLGERALLGKLATIGYPPGAPLPPGDDAGGVWMGDEAWLLKTDGFLYREVALSGMGPFEVGFRGVAATASDLIAKMGRPLGFTLGLFLPEDLEEAFVLELVKGAAEAARRLQAPLLGGDTNAGPEVALTVSGFARTEVPVPRRALPGDLLYLAGDRWGRTGAAIRAHYEGRDLGAFPAIREAAFYPLPRLELLSLKGLLRGSLDSSDGLAETLWQLADLGVRVDLLALPIYPDVLAFAKGEEEARGLVLYGGEEFEAVLVVPKEGEAEALARAEEAGLPLFLAGRIGQGNGVYFQGRPVPRKGYTHF